MKFKQKKVIPSSIWDVIRLPLLFTNGGFTLIEILVTVLIIGILAAVAVPQYQRAVLKSRYAGLMPIAKSMANSNEAYYLEHGEYADNAEDLPVQGRQNYPDGTELEFGTDTDYSYVLATRENNFPNNYIVYQKHSANYPGEIHCEAAADNTQAQDVCKSFGPTQDIGETLTTGYLTYVLSGTGNGNAPIPCPDGATCDGSGHVTECPDGETLNNGSCEECETAFPGASACSTTAYKATACSTGYVLKAGVCEQTPTCGGVSQPADMVLDSGITGTASCVDGKWVWQWTGEKENNSGCGAGAGDTTTCSNAIYGPNSIYCYGRTANACANSVFTGSSYCYGDAANACSNSVFVGNTCTSQYGEGVCTNSTFLKGDCKGFHDGDCAGSKFYPGSSCYARNGNPCSGTKYAYDENGNIGYCSEAGGTCPTGVPLINTLDETVHVYGSSGEIPHWKGNCCNPAYMVSGVCPSGVPECAS